MPTVLIADDNQKVVDMLRRTLIYEGYEVVTALDGYEALAQAQAHRPDVIVLDWLMPGVDGLEVARRVSKADRIPIIMLTARDALEDRVMGLDSGADDYLVKPFEPAELLARIRALLRRARAQATVADAIARVRAYRFGAWELNIGLRRLKSADGRAVELTNGEFSLLAAFVSSPQRVLSRDQLLDLSRLHNAEVYDRSIDVQILRLRRKIEADPARPQFIKTERGAGYLFDAVVDIVR